MGAMGSRFAAGRKVRIYPGGRKAATAVASTSFSPNLTFLAETKDLLSSSHPTGILPGKVNI